jgi:hypothetical protein
MDALRRLVVLNHDVRFAQSGDGIQCWVREPDNGVTGTGITSDPNPEKALALAEADLKAKKQG